MEKSGAASAAQKVARPTRTVYPHRTPAHMAILVLVWPLLPQQREDCLSQRGGSETFRALRYGRKI
jgi:hypothetical protein